MSSSKRSATRIVSNLQQVQKKKKNEQIQATLFKSFSIVRTDDVPDMEANHTRFKCIHDHYSILNKQPIIYDVSKEQRAKDLEAEVDEMIRKMTDPHIEEDDLIRLGNDAEKKKQEMNSLTESLSVMKKAIGDITKARYNATRGLKYNQTSKNPRRISEFTLLIKKANKLLEVVDRLDEMRRMEKAAEQERMKKAAEQERIEKAAEQEKQAAVVSVNKPTTVNDSSEVSNEEEMNVVENVFPSRMKYNSPRKTLEKMREKAQIQKLSPKLKFGKNGDLLHGALLPLQTRLQYKDLRGSGLFKKAVAWNFFKSKMQCQDELSWWIWTPVKLENNKISDYGEITCRACSSTMMHLRSITGHLASSHHKKAIVKKKKQLQHNEKPSIYLQNRIEKYITCPRIISKDEKQHQMDAVRAAVSANIPLVAMDEIEQSPYHQRFQEKSISLGHISHLGDDYIPIVFHEDLEILRIILKPWQKENDNRTKVLVYQHFSIIFDGTPSFAEAEAVMIRIVMKNGNILTLLVRCALFKEKLNATAVANHLIESIEQRLGLNMTYCRAVMCDRASTNKAALRLLKEKYGEIHEGKHLSFLTLWCISHTLSNAGKKLYNKEITPNIDRFRSIWQQIIQYPGHARDHAASSMNKAVKEGGGIRFFTHYEQIVQIVEYGLEKILLDIIPTCLDMKWSYTSATNMKEEFGTDEKIAELAMAMFEGSVVADFGRAFCKACYTLEGSSPLVFTAAEELQKISEKLEEEIPMNRVEAVVNRVSELLALSEQKIKYQKESINEELKTATSKVTDADTVHKNAEHDVIRAQGGTVSADGRVRRGNQRYVDEDVVALAQEKVVIAKEKLVVAKGEQKEIEKRLNECVEKYDMWLKKYPHKTREELLVHANTMKTPSILYFKKQFLPDIALEENDENEIQEYPNRRKPGDLVHATPLLQFCNTILNPLWIEKNYERVDFMKTQSELILPKFCFPEFDDEFIMKFIREIPKIITYVRNSSFKWDEMEKSLLFKTRLEKKKRKYAEDYEVDDDWRKDPGEKATRIWAFWRSVIVDDFQFPTFSLALQLISLIQVSSCEVERVFSQLKCVVERIGTNMNEDVLEIRMFAMCNGDLTEIWVNAFEGLFNDNN